jgi:hypothetical protein
VGFLVFPVDIYGEETAKAVWHSPLVDLHDVPTPLDIFRKTRELVKGFVQSVDEFRVGIRRRR